MLQVEGSSSLIPGELVDPSLQPKFTELVPNALDDGFKYKPVNGNYSVAACKSFKHETGLLDEKLLKKKNAVEKRLRTKIYGYRQGNSPGNCQGCGQCTWPGRTFEVRSNESVFVDWENELIAPKARQDHILTSRDGVPVVDVSLHWAYDLKDYEDFTIRVDFAPIAIHVHGAHVDFQYDGNPEFFFTPNDEILGPQWYNYPELLEDGKVPIFEYDNSQEAASIWYHDHALGQ